MECNKDEAIRAKSIAEKKMANNDFLGAQKIALKAQNLYPELDNINQLLCICEVHCAAQSRLFGSEKDWYGILQVEKLADELTVKKQYRRLALTLHPDKNRFPGAEAAFKLICEAHTVLSDPARKSPYDSKLRVLIKSSGPVHSPSHPPNRSSQSNRQNVATENNFSNGFGNLNQHQATQSAASVKQETFWTRCPFCGVRYQYLSQFLKRALRCQTCLKVFIGVEVIVQGASMSCKASQSSAQDTISKPDSSQPASRETVSPKQGHCKTGIQNDKGSSASDAGLQGTASRKTARPKPGVQRGSSTEGIRNRDSNAKKADVCNAKSSGGVDEGGPANGDAIKRKADGQKNKNRKRSRKLGEESSESFDASSESDEEEVIVSKKSGARYVNSLRRSSRQRQRVSYNETDEHGLGGPRRVQAMNEGEEKVRTDALDSEDTVVDHQNSFSNDSDYSEDKSDGMETINSEESLQKGADSDTEGRAEGETDGKPGTAADPEVSLCPDPEFNDFDNMRDEKQFAANQYWALYDILDGMPRFYAKVKKVCSDPFNLVITWLEAVPVDKSFATWVDRELPVSCGTFKFGETEETSIRLSFSHQVHCDKGKKRGSLILHPRRGEVWALFKDWDISWSSDPEIHNELKFEVVEVLSDFVADTGIEVTYLDKVGGFLSLFQRRSQSENDAFLIGPKELYKFSHRVPGFTMTGSEREGVPKGSFELDPAALPVNPEDLYYPSKADVEHMNS